MSLRSDAEAAYAKALALPVDEGRYGLVRQLSETDLYFLLTNTCGTGRGYCRHDWAFRQCRLVQSAPDGYLDLWARGHLKSTIITFALTLFDIINNPEETITILSYNRPSGKGFLRQLKREMETNPALHELWPHIFWKDPQREAPLWSEDGGLLVKRKGNPKEPTVAAFGLVDSQPVGWHPTKVIYEDVVTRDSVGTPEMIEKTTTATKESLAIGGNTAKRRGIGTRWHYSDTYQWMIDNQVLIPRVFPAWDADNKPVFMLEERLNKLAKDMTPVVAAAQLYLDPKKGTELGFSEQSIRYYQHHNDAAGMNVYILVDPANSRKKDSSYTAMSVIGLGPDLNRYWLDGVRDRLAPSDRRKALFALHRNWQGRVGPQRQIPVGYEGYGTQEGDIDEIRAEQERQNYRFPIIRLAGKLHKDDRIMDNLEPDYRDGRWYWPEVMIRTRQDGLQVDLVHEFKFEEFLAYPYGRHPDMLDCMSRIKDPELNAVWPMADELEDERDRRYPRRGSRRPGGWMAA